MNGAFKIATLRRIPIKVHLSFLVALPFLALMFGRVFKQAAMAASVPSELLRGHPMLWGLALALALFASVLIHEMAHALYAVSRGGKVSDITLLMIGGVSRIPTLPPKPSHEAWMALVGPLTSFALGALFLGAHFGLKGLGYFNLSFLFFYLGQMNVFLGVFNLLPAFPMDGGRILRSVLTRKMGKVRATRLSGSIGKGFALLFGLYGLVSFNFVLTLIAFFVYIGAETETRQVFMEAALGKVRVHEMMSHYKGAVGLLETLDAIGQRMKAERKVAFPVLAPNGHVEGMVTLRAMRDISKERRAALNAGSVMETVEPVSPDDDVWKALREMNQRRLPQLPVVLKEELVGSISLSDILRGLELHELEETPKGRLFIPPHEESLS